ncbi:MAG TPA: hypothetical protein VF815_43775 [Myxococcaceae bacterium]|jgi:hypothetical protein
MVHGEEKARDMARSLLPSRWRKGARKERALVHRGSRREPKEALARLAREPEGWDEQPFPKDTSQREIRGVVQHRRWADKVNPFIRWATTVTRELPRESRLSHIQGLLPQGVIGEHALDHLERTEAFENLTEREWRYAHWWGRGSKSGWMERGEQAQLLRQVLQAPEGHRTFNRWLHYHPAAISDRWGRRVTPVRRVRTLLGVHDVLPFLDTVGRMERGRRGRRSWGPANPQSDLFPLMDHFLRAFKKCRGDVAATLKELGVRLGHGEEPYFVKLPAES